MQRRSQSNPLRRSGAVGAMPPQGGPLPRCHAPRAPPQAAARAPPLLPGPHPARPASDSLLLAAPANCAARLCSSRRVS